MEKLLKRFDNKEGNEDSRIQITLTKSEKEEWEKCLKNEKKNKKTSIRVRMNSDMKKHWIDISYNSKRLLDNDQIRG